MRPCPIEIHHIPIEHALELLLMEDQQMVKAFLPHTPQETLTDRIGSRSMIRRFENLNSTCRRHSGKTGPKFAIVITDQIFRRFPAWQGVAHVLCDPAIGRGAGTRAV